MELFLALYSISAKSNAPNSQEIILMGIAQSQAVLHTLISSVHVFSEVINLKSPNKDARWQPWLPRLKVTLLWIYKILWQEQCIMLQSGQGKMGL